MNSMASIDMLEAAAYALVSARCRPSYLHDIRGGLQALHSGVELLVRVAQSPAPDPVLAGKAAGLARNALVKHEKALVDLLDQMAPRREAVAAINVGEMLADVLRFLRNEAATKSITFRFEATQDILVLAHAHRFRLLMLGLCVTLIDELAGGSSVEITAAKSDRYAVIEIISILPNPAIPTLEQSPLGTGLACSLRELLLFLTQAWASEHGGRLELEVAAPPANAIRLYHPLHAA